MGIKKQDFYEGAAFIVLFREGGARTVSYEPPFYRINDKLRIYLKYSTRKRSPWGFTFTSEEQIFLHNTEFGKETVLGLICGADGVAAISCEDYRGIASPRKNAVHVACYRLHGEHYQVNGPDGSLSRKVPPSAWQRLLYEVTS
jgi:hypothetical protein